MRESLRFVLVANDICSSISERDDDDDDNNERERVLESVKRTFCRFFPFVFEETTLLYFVASHGPQNGPQNGPKMVRDGPKMMQMTTARRGSLKTNKNFARAFGTHTHTDNADRGRAQKPGRLSNVPDMPRDLQSAV